MVYFFYQLHSPSTPGPVLTWNPFSPHHQWGILFPQLNCLTSFISQQEILGPVCTKPEPRKVQESCILAIPLIIMLVLLITFDSTISFHLLTGIMQWQSVMASFLESLAIEFFSCLPQTTPHLWIQVWRENTGLSCLTTASAPETVKGRLGLSLLYGTFFYY